MQSSSPCLQPVVTVLLSPPPPRDQYSTLEATGSVSGSSPWPVGNTVTYVPAGMAGTVTFPRLQHPPPQEHGHLSPGHLSPGLSVPGS
jgi:hypothetical protein